jgi:hypothetical protein
MTDETARIHRGGGGFGGVAGRGARATARAASGRVRQWRIGCSASFVAAFRNGLAETGHVDGQNVCLRRLR